MLPQQIQQLQQQLGMYATNINALRNEISSNPHSANREMLAQYEAVYNQIHQQIQQYSQQQHTYNTQPQYQPHPQQQPLHNIGGINTIQPTSPSGSGGFSKYAMDQDTQQTVENVTVPGMDITPLNTTPNSSTDTIPLFGEDYEPLALHPSTKEVLGDKHRWILCGPPDDTVYPKPIQIEGDDIGVIDLIALSNCSSSILKEYIHVIEDGSVGVCGVDVIEVIHSNNPTIYKSLPKLLASDLNLDNMNYDNDNVNLAITAHFNSYLKLGCFGYHTIDNVGDIPDLIDLTDSDDKPTDYIGTVRDIIPSLGLTIERDKEYIDNIRITQQAAMVICRNEDMCTLLGTITTEPMSLTLKSNRGLYQLLLTATDSFKDTTILFIVTPEHNYKGIYNAYTKIICIEQIA